MSEQLDFCIVCDDQWKLNNRLQNYLTTIIDNRSREFTVCGRCEVAIEWYKTITDEVIA
jgi:hypothetical protein